MTRPMPGPAERVWAAVIDDKPATMYHDDTRRCTAFLFDHEAAGKRLADAELRADLDLALTELEDVVPITEGTTFLDAFRRCETLTRHLTHPHALGDPR